MLAHELESRPRKGGISRLAPPSPKARLQRLPPILRIPGPLPVPNCSKAPRGLFVLPRDNRIFTVNSISPGPSSRQCPDRYAFRAGRNLPDKEFRYLRQLCCRSAPVGGGGRSFLPASACRHAVRTISSRPFRGRVRRMVSEGSERPMEAFGLPC